MKLRIGKYKISTDKYNFMLEEEIIPKRKRSESGGQPYWVPLSYHSTLELACQKLMQCDIKKAEVDGLCDVVSNVKKSTEAIVQAVLSLKEAPVLKGDK